MKIHPSARRHGCSDADIRWAVANVVATGVAELNRDSKAMGLLVVGPNRTGDLIEVITVMDDDGQEVVIHAMPARRWMLRNLQEGPS